MIELLSDRTLKMKFTKLQSGEFEINFENRQPSLKSIVIFITVYNHLKGFFCNAGCKNQVI